MEANLCLSEVLQIHLPHNCVPICNQSQSWVRTFERGVKACGAATCVRFRGSVRLLESGVLSLLLVFGSYDYSGGCAPLPRANVSEHRPECRYVSTPDICKAVHRECQHCSVSSPLLPTTSKATGAHPDEGMDPPQLLAFFARATNASLHLTKESLEKVVKNVDEDGDGLVRKIGLTQRGQKTRRLHVLLVAGPSIDYLVKVAAGGEHTQSIRIKRTVHQRGR